MSSPWAENIKVPKEFPPGRCFERSRLSLRFVNTRIEKAFIRTQANSLDENLFQFSLILGCVSIVRVAILLLSENADSDAKQQLQLGATVALAAVSALAAVGVLVHAPRWFSPSTWEAIVVCHLLVLSALQFFADPWYAARALQQDPEVVGTTQGPSRSFSDTKTILVLSIIIVVGHLALPIRWACLLALEVGVVLLYGFFAFIAGGPEGNDSWGTLVLLQLLVLLAALGRRTIEDYQRRSFDYFVKEELRAATERHVLPHMSGKTGIDSPLAGDDSLPVTTPSSAMFELPDGVGAQAGILRQCLDLGRRENWYIAREEVFLSEEVIGKGNYGIVKGGMFHGSPVAVKTGRVYADAEEDGSGWTSTLVSLLNEIKILRRMRHPNIVLFHGACLDIVEGDVALVLERVSGKSLQEVVSQHPGKPLLLPDRLRAIVDVSRALRYLHSCSPHVVHGDLKAPNIFVEQAPGTDCFYRAKLLDFGLARTLTRHAKPMGGTARWMAPEVFLYPHQKPRSSADVFSFGRVVHFVLTGITPCKGYSYFDIHANVALGRLPELKWPGDLDDVLLLCKMLVEACVEFQQRDRPTMEEVGPHFEEASEIQRLGPGILFHDGLQGESPARQSNGMQRNAQSEMDQASVGRLSRSRSLQSGSGAFEALFGNLIRTQGRFPGTRSSKVSPDEVAEGSTYQDITPVTTMPDLMASPTQGSTFQSISSGSSIVPDPAPEPTQGSTFQSISSGSSIVPDPAPEPKQAPREEKSVSMEIMMT